jgi:hypothetical protein
MRLPAYPCCLCEHSPIRSPSAAQPRTGPLPSLRRSPNGHSVLLETWLAWTARVVEVRPSTPLRSCFVGTRLRRLDVQTN